MIGKHERWAIMMRIPKKYLTKTKIKLLTLNVCVLSSLGRVSFFLPRDAYAYIKALGDAQVNLPSIE